MSIKIENAVFPSPEQWQAAIRGMRNAKNSWDKSDSRIPEGSTDIEIGEADIKLMRSLCRSGSSHRKFLRMLPVIVDITAPTYWVSELDTYKLGTVRNSCSFMHTGTNKPFEMEDFSVESGKDKACVDLAVWMLNRLRENYIETKDEETFRAIRNILPASYNIRFTWSANYETLLNIYNQRQGHRLPEWHTFCEWIEKLPYFQEICFTDKEK